jgi:hypothetical protein
MFLGISVSTEADQVNGSVSSQKMSLSAELGHIVDSQLGHTKYCSFKYFNQLAALYMLKLRNHSLLGA